MAIWTVIKRSFKQLYEHLFLYVLLNVIWFVMVAIVIFIGYSGVVSGWFIPLIVPVVLSGPIFLSGLHIANRVIKREEFNLKLLLTGIRDHFKKGLMGFLFSLIVYLVLSVDLVFFVRRGTDSIFILILAVILFYLLLFFSITQLFFWGLLTCQPRVKLFTIVKRSVLLTLDNIIFSFLWLLSVIILIIILTVTGIGLPVLFMGLIGLMVINGVRFILEKYEAKEKGDKDV